MIRVLFILIILCFPCELLAGESHEFDKDERFEITLNALKNRIALNTYYEITKQYHRLNYVIDMQEEVLNKPFFENVDLVEHKLKEIHDFGQFGMYVIISIPYAPQFNETPEQIEKYHKWFTSALYDKGYHEASAGKGVIVNIDGTIKPKPSENKMITAYTAYIGFGSSLANETIQQGVNILKNFNYNTESTPSKTQACIKLVEKVYLAFIGSPDLNFNASEYTLVYSIDSEWEDIYKVDIDDPQPEDLLVIPTKYGTIKDYTGILKRSEDQQSIDELVQRIDGENELLENPVFRVYITSDYHLSNSRSAIQLVYEAKEQIKDNEVILGVHFRSSDAGIEVQYEIFIGDNYVYPEQKQRIATTFILPFLKSDDPFGKILQETLFISLEYASLMGKASTAFEKSNVPREWWDNDNYFFYLSPEVAGIIDGSLEIAGGAVSMSSLMVDIGGLGVDLVSDNDETIASIRKEAGEVMFIALEGMAAYALLSEAEQDTLIAQVQGEITQEVSDYLTLITSGTRVGRYEASKLAFNIISSFVGIAELKILFKTGKWPSATVLKIKDAKNAFQGTNKKEAIKGLLRNIFKKQSIVVAKRLNFKPSWLPDRVIEGNLDNPVGLIGTYEKKMPDGSIVSDTKKAIEELGYPETFASNFETVSKDGFKMLNTNRFYSINNPSFWKDFNEPWLDYLVSKKASIIVLTDKNSDLLIYKWELQDGTVKYLLDENLQKIKSGFGKEVDYMENLVKNGKYKWDVENGVYKCIDN